MAHPQNSPRGLFTKNGVAIGGQTLTYNTTTNGLTFSNPVSAKPSTDQGNTISLVKNSTGVALVVNTTGTTWKYLNVTSKQPT